MAAIRSSRRPETGTGRRAPSTSTRCVVVAPPVGPGTATPSLVGWVRRGVPVSPITPARGRKRLGVAPPQRRLTHNRHLCDATATVRAARGIARDLAQRLAETHLLGGGEAQLSFGLGRAALAGLLGDRGGDGPHDLAVEDRRDDVVLAQLIARDDVSAIARAAAVFIVSVISVARASSAPRKTPGKQRTLLIWLG